MKPAVRLSVVVILVLTTIAWLPIVLGIPIQVGSRVLPPWAVILFAVALAGCAVTLWSVSRQPQPPQARVDQIPPEPQSPLEEYKLAQASAEHHDKLLWTTTGIVWGGSLALLSLASKELRAIQDSSPRVLVSLLGIALTVAVWWMASVWNRVKLVKYERCQELERRFGYRQHLQVNDVYPQGRMRILYAVVSLILLGAWLAVLYGP